MGFITWVKYACVALVFYAVYILVLRACCSRIFNGRVWKIKSWFEPKPVQRKTAIPWDAKTLRWLAAFTSGAGVLAGFVLGGADWKEPLVYVFSGIGGGLGLLLPRILVAFWQKQHLQALDLQLPSALELISNSLRAGLSIVQALEVVAKETPKPIAHEFEIVIRDCRLGLSPEDALEKMLKRWNHHNLELFVVAAGVSIKTGGNLAEVAERMMETVHERFRLRGRIDSLTAQGKLSGWVVGLLPVVLLFGLMLLDKPLMTGFLHHPLGIAMLSCGVVMELIGVFFIRKIISIET